MMQKIDQLTGIRAFAALWVLSLHMIGSHGHLLGFFEPVIKRGGVGVDLFFVLSGFILSYVYQLKFAQWDWGTVWRFLCLRLARLYPVHVVILLVMFADCVFSRAVIDWPSFIQKQLLVDAWQLVTPLTWNIGSWSISAEWFAYLLFPVLALYWRQTTHILFVLGVYFFCEAVQLTIPMHAGVIVFPLFRVACAFSMGMFVYRLYCKNTAPDARWDWVNLATFIGVALLLALDVHQALIIPLFGVMIYSLGRSASFMHGFFSHPVSVYLGDISYSLYMCHPYVIDSAKRLAHHLQLYEGRSSLTLNSGTLILSIATVVAILIISMLLYHFVEVPGRSFVKRLVDTVPKVSKRFSAG